MTEPELINQLRESIVLDGPDAWRSNGYLEDAQRAGWKLVTAIKQATKVSQEMASYRDWIQNIRTRIAQIAQSSGQPTEGELELIVRAAAALNLSADFVRNRWVPTELARQRDPSVPIVDGTKTDARPDQPTGAPTAVSLTATELITPAVFIAPDTAIEPTVSDGAPPDGAEARPTVRSFSATPARIRRGDSALLAWTVDNLTSVTVDDLGSGLASQHRAWVKPSATTEYTLFDPDKKPLDTVRVEVMPRDRSVLYGVLGALLLIAAFLWYDNARSDARASMRAIPSPVTQSRRPFKTSAGSTYKEVAGDADERGWRRARSNGRWGFIDKDDQWVIQPEYDAVTQFRRGKAVVIQKGRLLTINRDGEVVSPERIQKP